jgi:hypothetical protein
MGDFPWKANDSDGSFDLCSFFDAISVRFTRYATDRSFAALSVAPGISTGRQG